MSTVLDGEYVTVAEAANLLRVNKSTIRRWIAQGDLLAYRVGKRRLALKRSDVARVITPAREITDQSEPTAPSEEIHIPPLTPAQREEALAAMARARELREEIRRKYGGQLFPPSWEALAELRDERSRQLQ